MRNCLPQVPALHLQLLLLGEEWAPLPLPPAVLPSCPSLVPEGALTWGLSPISQTWSPRW